MKNVKTCAIMAEANKAFSHYRFNLSGENQVRA